MPSANRSEAGDLEDYGRAAAHQSGLAIDEAWWPSVSRHLATLLGHAGTVESFKPEDGDESLTTPAPVFDP